jgi:trimeric autotransporter adhesin
MRHIRFWVSLLLLLNSGITAVCQQPTANGAKGTVPQLVKFSGVLTDVNGKPLTDIVGVTFSLYQADQGGSPLWLETQNVQPDRTGHYSVMLGSTTSQGLPPDLFVSGEARWLAVQAQGQPEYPRVLLVSVPYALKAADAQTVGGLPPSAFVLAAPGSGSNGSNNANGTAASVSSAPSTSSNVTTTGGTVNALPLWTTTTNIQSSAITQSGTGSTAKVGINTTKPAATLDVAGGADVRGLLSLPTTGTATSTGGKNSQPLSQSASVFNSGTKTAVPQTFQWQAEPVGNNTSTATGSLNLQFGQGTSKPAETGLSIASNGQISFATGQTFPGTGDGTVTIVATGPGLAGGPITGSGKLSIATGGVTNAMLENPSLTVAAGTDLTGGGPVSLGGATTLNLDTTKVPQLTTANTFTGNQTVNGNLTATGPVTGSSFQIGSNLFAFGNYGNENAFLGFAGNTTTTGSYNTASGYQALSSNTMGYQNTAIGGDALANDRGAGDGSFAGSVNTAVGFNALLANTTGAGNAASGVAALKLNTTGSYNTATGYASGRTGDSSNAIGFGNTFLGALSATSTGSLSNATAIGANAEVDESNALVLGSINGVNGATASTNVGIGTTAPTYLLHIGNTGGANYNNFLRVEGPVNSGTGGMAASFGGYGDFGIDRFGIAEGRFVVKENGFVGINTSAPDADLTVDGTADKPGGGSWATFSDRRLKTLDGSFHSGLDQVLKLNPVRYRYKEENGMGIRDPEDHIGLVAQEVQRIIPEAVTENSKGYLLVNNDPIIWAMLNAIKEQQREIASQRAQIRKLRDKDTRQAHVLQNLAAQVTILQSKLAKLDGNVSWMRQAKKAPAKSTRGDTVVAKARF